MDTTLQSHWLHRIAQLKEDRQRIVDAWFAGNTRAEERAARRKFRAFWGITFEQSTTLLNALESAPLEGDE